MKKQSILKTAIIAGLTLLFFSGVFLSCGNNGEAKEAENRQETTEKAPAEEELPGSDKLVVIWSCADREVALNMAFMYTTNSARFNWWKDITFVVWGPSQKLLVEDEELQKGIKSMIDSGITVKACKTCSDGYGISKELRAMGIDVKLMSELTLYMQEGRNILTF